MKAYNILFGILLITLSLFVVYAQAPSKGVIKVGNAAPTISTVTVTSDATSVASSPTKPTNETDYVRFTVTWADPNGDPISVFVCKTSAATTSGCTAGTWASSASSSTNPRILDYTTLTTDPETNPAFVFVSDGLLLSSEASGDQTFYVNHRPFASAVTTNPGAPTEASTLSCAYTFNDNDIGDSERISDARFQWYKKVGGLGSFTLVSGEFSYLLTNTNFNEGDVLICRTKVTDDHGLSDDIFVNSTNFVTILNSPPEAASALLVQDGGAPDFDDGTIGHDGTAAFDTHMKTPEIRWTKGTDLDAADTIYTYICIDTVSGGCNLAGAKTTLATYTVSPDILDYLGASRTYYIKLVANDGTVNSSAYTNPFALTNDIPTAPSGLTPKRTHDSTPFIDYADSIDADTAGTIDNYPADTLTYFYTSGTTGTGSSDLVNNVPSALSQFQYSSAIPWGTTEVNGWNNRTVNVRAYSSDGNTGGTSFNYDDTFVLYNFLPDIVQIQITDSGSFYTDQAVNPIAHSTAFLAIRMQATDRDGDCAVGHIAKAGLCDTTISSCRDSNVQYRFTLNKVSVGPGDDCYYEILGNASTGTPEFWKDSGTWKVRANITEDISVGSGNKRAIDLQNLTTFTYNQLNAAYYPGIILLGGSSIILGVFNINTTATVMENWGNIDLDLQWKATDPISSNDYWNLSVEGDDDFFIDDDADLSLEPAASVPITLLQYTDTFFDPNTGLQNCNSDLCDSPLLNETLATFYHIRPPLGLLPGLYNNTITITRSLHV